MDNYIKDALQEFKHVFSKQHYNSSSRFTPIKCGQKIQYTETDNAPPMTKDQVKFVQQVTGKLLFYARAIDNLMLHALNDIATKTNQGTTTTLAAAHHLLHYAASNPNGQIRFTASDMVLNCHSDAAYLVAPESRSRAGGFHFLGDKNRTQFNGPILVLAKIIKHVMSSAAEAEVGAMFLNAREAIPIRKCLENMDHPQPPTPMTVDNYTAIGVVDTTMKQRQSKVFGKNKDWLRDRMLRGQFDYH